jgi:hypothetical protein
VSEERISTVYLGQFAEDRAERIARALERAGILFWEKRAGRIARFLFIGEWGVRLFVDASRLEEARAIAAQTR